MAEKYITPVFRGSFVHLNEPHAPPAGPGETPKEKYSITVVLRKDNKEHMAFKKKMDAAIKELLHDKYGDPKLKKFKWTNPMKDGDDEVIEQWEDCFVFMASTDRQPGVVDRAKQPIIDPDELYAGAHYRASVSLYAWKHPTGGIGLSFSLSNVMKIKDDDAFDGRTSAEDDFEDIDYEDELAEEDEGDDLS